MNSEKQGVPFVNAEPEGGEEEEIEGSKLGGLFSLGKDPFHAAPFFLATVPLV
jgi:hypothetical protein